MNDKERIEILEAMLTEERGKVSHTLSILESYARGLDMMAQTAFAYTLLGFREEKNASSMKQHTADMVGWIEMKVDELRGLMGRAMPAGQVEMTESEAKAMFDELMAFVPGPVVDVPPEAPEPPAPVEVEDAERSDGVTIH